MPLLKHVRRVRYLALAAALSLLAGYWVSQITGAAVNDDAAQTLRMAINLDREGIISRDVAPPYTPSMYREPFPVWALAFNLKILDWITGPSEADSYFEGDGARYLKYMNLLWFALLTGCAFWACWLFSSSIFLSSLTAVLVNVRLPMTLSGPLALGIDSLYTEQMAAALMLLGSTFLALAVARGRFGYCIAAGASFGFLTLTKAAFLFISAGLISVLLILLVPVVRRILPHRINWQLILISVVAYATVVLPWMYRNHVQFDSWQIAERGGVILHLRAIKDQMTDEEYRGTFYVWAPGLREMWGRLLGYSEADLQEGGRLQRLNRSSESDFAAREIAAEIAGDPENTISYYRRARADRIRLIREYTENGSDNPRIEADRDLQEQALESIRGNLGRHLAMTIPFLWRGALTSSIALLLCLAYALARRKTDLLLLILPALGTIAFYALFTHFIPRYAVQVVPLAIVAGLVIVGAMWDWALTRLSGTAAAETKRPFLGSVMFSRVAGQFSRYLLMGGVSAIVTLGIPLLLHEVFQVAEEIAVVVALIVAFAVNFLTLRFFVFRIGSGAAGQLLRFALTSGAFRIGEYILFLLSYNLLKLHYMLALGSTLVMSIILKFAVYRLFVFVDRPPAVEAG